MTYCFSTTVIKRINLKTCSSSIRYTKLSNKTIPTITTMNSRRFSSSTTQNPSLEYLDISNQPSTLLTEIQKQLLILDLNGTLLSRTRRKNGMFVRPNINVFLDYIFDNFNVMVWSSAQERSVKKMLQLFDKNIDKLALIWTRSDMGLTIQQYHSKAETVKDLQMVWDTLNGFDATNTIMIDDSPAKAILQPYNNIPITTFDHTSSQFLLYGDNELFHIMDYLNKLKYQSNVSNFIQSTSYKSSSFLASSCHPSSKICKYYQIDFKKPNTIPSEHDFSFPIEELQLTSSSAIIERKIKKKVIYASDNQNLENPMKKKKKKKSKINKNNSY